ncbi:hypothetical protein G9C98_001280 [Cotesia typhae]|uniref:Uncharacterized protein n=1 Tax=Cotesia typhae TaxID=2053667 RepID=A0A8J5QP63_9HYME|nr:hypothetical protein G9C98_001280 [Cotesia typhae]
MKKFLIRKSEVANTLQHLSFLGFPQQHIRILFDRSIFNRRINFLNQRLAFLEQLLGFLGLALLDPVLVESSIDLAVLEDDKVISTEDLVVFCLNRGQNGPNGELHEVELALALLEVLTVDRDVVGRTLGPVFRGLESLVADAHGNRPRRRFFFQHVLELNICQIFRGRNFFSVTQVYKYLFIFVSFCLDANSWMRFKSH